MSRPLVFESVLGLIGSTPLVRIRAEDEKGGKERANVWGKLENENPGGSVKDRIAHAMIEAAEKSGALVPGGVVIEPTSGNTGIGLAIVCAVKGYRCILTMPETMSLERRQLLEAFGAEIVLTSGERQMEGAVMKARELAAQTPGAFLPHQFDNPANPKAHEGRTSREILDAMAGEKIDATITQAPGNHAALGGVKVQTANGWFAARPSGTEDIYKIYAESFVSAEHLKSLQAAGQALAEKAG